MTGLLIKDKWTGDDDDPWDPTIWPVVRNVRGSAAAPTIQSNTGRMTVAEGVECHVVAALTPTLADQDISFIWRAVTFGGTYPPDPGMYPEVYYRVSTNVESGDPPADGYMLQFTPRRKRITLWAVDEYDVIGVKDDVAIDNTDPHWFRIRVQGSNHKVKWWHEDGNEPPTWNMDFTHSTYTSGRTMLGMYSNDAMNFCECEWDTLRVEELLPAEPGIHLNEGAMVAAYVGTQPLLQCFLGSVEVPVP